MPFKQDDIVEHPFALGLDNRSPETQLPEGALREAVNVDIYSSSYIKRRRGMTQRYSGTFVHSVWSTNELDYMYFVDNGTLYHFDIGSYTETSVATGLHPSAPVSYTYYNDAVYYCNGLDTGKLVGTTRSDWGVSVPSAPVLTAGAGTLAAGDYAVTWTHVLASGEEGGAPPGDLITLSSTGGISVTAPNTSGIDKFRVYVTDVNGNDYFQCADIDPGDTYIISSGNRGRRLTTLNAVPPMMLPGTIVRAYRNRIYWVVGQAVYYTTPFNPNLTFPARDFYFFESTPTMLGVQIDGLYVGLDRRTYWIDGADPENVSNLIVAHAHGAIPGTEVLIPSDRFFIADSIPDVGYSPAWVDSQGVTCIGRPSGTVQRLNADRFHATEYKRGAQVAVEHNGIEQLISALSGQEGDIASFGDTVTAEVVQNNLT